MQPTIFAWATLITILKSTGHSLSPRGCNTAVQCITVTSSRGRLTKREKIRAGEILAWGAFVMRLKRLSLAGRGKLANQTNCRAHARRLACKKLTAEAGKNRAGPPSVGSTDVD